MHYVDMGTPDEATLRARFDRAKREVDAYELAIHWLERERMSVPESMRIGLTVARQRRGEARALAKKHGVTIEETNASPL